MIPIPRKAFMDATPPPGYVAGLGRGATGFTTRSDIGPARGENEQILERGQHRRSAKREADEEEKDEPMDLSESKFDKFSGYEGSLFSNTPYEQDDEEADLIYGRIDQHMDKRRKMRREKREAEEQAKYREQHVKIEHQFSDIKDTLKTLSEDDWMAIPDVTGDRHYRPKKELSKFMPVPDSLIVKAHSAETSFHTEVADTPSGTETGILTDLNQIALSRKTVIGAKLDRVSDSVTGQTPVNTEGYLTDLRSTVNLSDADIGDLKKAELLLESVIRTNPKEASGWLAAARLQEKAGKLAQARKVIKRGCSECPEAEDVWLEAARLAPPDQARSVLAEAVTHLPKSVRIWIAAARLEVDVNKKKPILRRALEFVPNSVKLWKEAVQLESPDEAKILLWRAVECVPDSTELWLALARLETYENAQKVLNKARQTIPTDPEIWIAASMLQESNHDEGRCFSIIQKAVESLAANGVVINRDQWLEMAHKAEAAGAVHTCQAIIHNTIGLGVEDVDRKRVWLDDAEQMLKKGHVETARAIYAHALTIFKNKKSVWLKAAQLERERGTKTSLIELLQRAVTYCPKAEVLWLMAAKEAWQQGDVILARQILKDSFGQNPNSENIWLAAVKIEWESKEPDRAHKLLEKARVQCAQSPRVWMKSALLARWLNREEEEYGLLQEATGKFPEYAKLWLMAGQFLERHDSHKEALETYIEGLKSCPKSVPLWISLANVEEKLGSVMKARAVFDKARLKVPASAPLWIASIRLEMRAGNTAFAKKLMAEALQECNTSGVLWYEAIEMEPRTGKKAKLQDAVKQCEKDAYVVLAGGRVFWQEGNEKTLDKARVWLNKAVQYDATLGDAWANLYKFEVQHGTEEKQQDVIKRCVAAAPRYGEKWISVSKGPQGHTLNTEQILKKAALVV